MMDEALWVFEVHHRGGQFFHIPNADIITNATGLWSRWRVELRELKADGDILDMFAMRKGRSTISIYVENLDHELNPNDDNDYDYFAEGDKLFDSLGNIVSDEICNEVRSVEVGYGSGEGTSHSELNVPEIDEINPDNLNSSIHSSDDEDRVEFPEFNENTDMDKPDYQ
ncbi:unnamed protein product [Camellia sinensis]